MTDPKTRRFERDLRYLASKYKPKERFEGALEVVLLFQLPRPKSVRREYPSVKPDLDNFEKAVLDALKDFWKDDSQIICLYSRKRYGTIPLVKVEIGRPGYLSQEDDWRRESDVNEQAL